MFNRELTLDQFLPSPPYVTIHLPSICCHPLSFSASYALLFMLKREDLAEKWFGLRLLEKMKELNLEEKVMQFCDIGIAHSEKLNNQKRNGLYLSEILKIQLGRNLRVKDLQIFVKQIINLVPEFMHPADVEQFSRLIAKRLLAPRNQKAIITTKDLRLRCNSFFRTGLAKTITSPKDKLEIISAVSINSAHFLLQIILYYLKMYFVCKFNSKTQAWTFIRPEILDIEEKGEKRHLSEWIIHPGSKGETPMPPIVKINSSELKAEFKDPPFSLVMIKLNFLDNDNFVDRKSRLSLLLGTTLVAKTRNYPFYNKIDENVTRFLDLLPNYDKLVRKYGYSRSRTETVVPYRTLKSFVSAFLNFSPDWLSPTVKSSTNKVAVVLCTRLLDWRISTENFFSIELLSQANNFDYFAQFHGHEFSYEDRTEIVTSLAYHSFRLLCAVLLQTIYKTFRVTNDGNRLNLFFTQSKAIGDDHTTVPRPSKVADSRKRSQPGNTSPQHVDAVHLEPPPKKEKICITIDDDPIQDKKPSVVDLTPRLSEKTQEKEQEKENAHVFDPKQVKMEKNLETSNTICCSLNSDSPTVPKERSQLEVDTRSQHVEIGDLEPPPMREKICTTLDDDPIQDKKPSVVDLIPRLSKEAQEKEQKEKENEHPLDPKRVKLEKNLETSNTICCSLNLDSPTVLRKRTLLEVDTRSQHVEIVDLEPPPMKEKICITIDDDPIQDKKPSVVDLIPRLSEKTQEKEQEKENAHVFDPKQVKMQKNLETSNTICCSLNSDSPTVPKERSQLEVDTRSQHVEIVDLEPPPMREKICITIDDDPIQDKKPNLVELKRRMSQPAHEKEQKKVNEHLDPKLVKMEKNRGTSKKTEEVPEKVEDILIDKIDFLKFKTDIDSDQNILSIYKTIFGLALESREELRSRCVALMKEVSSLRSICNSSKP